MGAEYREVKATGNPTLIEDETLNDSDKVFTVPANRLWHILWIYIELTATATAGVRLMPVTIRDASDDTIYNLPSREGTSAFETRQFLWIAGVEYLSTPTQNHVLQPISPNLVVPAGFDIRIFDSAAIDPAADDMIVHMMVDEIGTPLTP